jgi:hypothetical protein
MATVATIQLWKQRQYIKCSFCYKLATKAMHKRLTNKVAIHRIRRAYRRLATNAAPGSSLELPSSVQENNLLAG